MKQTYWNLSEEEMTRKEIIDKYLLEKRFTQAKAASQLGICVRHFKRLLSGYRQYGTAALISKQRGQSSNNKIPDSIRQLALALVVMYYPDFGPTLAHEKLLKHHRHRFDRFFSVETLRRWMSEAGIHRSKKRKIGTVHQSRPRRRHFGDLIQIDGSYHDWFEGHRSPCTLIAFIDDATSAVTEWYFYETETTANYMLSLKHHLARYGLPLALYSDRHSIFSINAKEQHTLQQPSQFARALQQLGIQLITANSPQAKGRIERLFQTVQNRLPKELRLQGISTIEEANHFLQGYRHEHNQRFAKQPQSDCNHHCTEIPYSTRDLQLILSKQHTRKLSKNLICQYHNQQYLITTDQPSYALRGAKITVCELLNGEIVLLYQGGELPYTLYQEHPPLPNPQDAKTLNPTVDKLLKSQRRGHKAATDHPWKRWQPGYLGSNQR